jgi:alpha-galactosidase
LGVPEVATSIQRDQTLDAPHAVFGVAGSMGQVTSAMRSFIDQGIREGRPLNPPVIYNTWFAYLTEVDDETLRGEMVRARSVGAEIFVIDAGWYIGAGRGSDFVSGLGSWEPDPQKFPSGLGALADYAHGLGLKFGIWVEPERVALEMLGRVEGLREEWLATLDGKYQDDRSAQICLGSAAARLWLQRRLFALLDDTKADYLKWDNNFWINCTREGHNHGTNDGNFAHVSGLYGALQAIRTRYPNLIIENVAGGGRRLDLGMLRYTDTAWMDDRSAPSVHVRHNLEGLATVFPPAYLFAFVVNNRAEQLQSAADLSLYFRSRMIGVLGLCFRSDQLSADDMEAIGREVAIYASVRDILKDASAVLLTDQAAPTGGPPWDVLEALTGDAGGAIISAVQADDGVRRVTVRPTGLQPDAMYEVRSVDSGVLETATGATLMTDGIDVNASFISAAHLLVIKRQN